MKNHSRAKSVVVYTRVNFKSFKMPRGPPKSTNPKKKRLSTAVAEEVSTCDQELECNVVISSPQVVSPDLYDSIEGLDRQQVITLMGILQGKLSDSENVMDSNAKAVEVEDCADSSRPKRNVRSVYSRRNAQEPNQDWIDNIDSGIPNKVSRVIVDEAVSVPVPELNLPNLNNNARKENANQPQPSTSF
ncbi:MAG: hypothetical protein GY705_12500, partial [Bacteroidetes bacterium]|nr:hypothetical protein [Bacteroidota bacterium]